MKAILSLVIVGLFVSCSGNNPANSKEEIIVGTWDKFYNNEYDETVEFKADRTYESQENDKLWIYKWEINGDIMTFTEITGEIWQERYRIEIISDDLWVSTQVYEDGTESKRKRTYRRVKSD